MAAVLTVLLQVGVYAVLYVVTPSHDLKWFVDTSLDRLIVQVFPALSGAS